MNIAFDGRVLRHECATGVEVVADAMYRALKQLVDIDVVVPNSGNKYCQHFWEHFILPFKARKADVLFCPANIAPVWRFKRTKLVVTLHDVAYLTYPDSISKAFGIYYRWLIPKILQRADAVVTISEASKQEIVKYYPDALNKLHVIHNGISKQFTPIEYEAKQKSILYVGSLNERKNFVSVIAAFERLPESLSEYGLTVVGNFSENFDLSPQTRKVLERAKRNHRITFLEALSFKELRHQYASATVFLFPSFYEGFGFPPLEAMASGTPVVTSNVSSMPEVCSDAAVYIDPYSVDDITETLTELLQNEPLRHTMIAKGLEHVKRFTWEGTAEAYLALFEKVAAQ